MRRIIALAATSLTLTLLGACGSGPVPSSSSSPISTPTLSPRVTYTPSSAPIDLSPTAPVKEPGACYAGRQRILKELVALWEHAEEDRQSVGYASAYNVALLNWNLLRAEVDESPEVNDCMKYEVVRLRPASTAILTAIQTGMYEGLLSPVQKELVFLAEEFQVEVPANLKQPYDHF